MKSFYTLTIGLFMLFASACSQQEVTETQAEQTVAAAVVPNATTTLDIEGMTCEMGCKAAIEKHLNKTTGVATCAVDFQNAIAVIEYDSNVITEEQLIAEVGEVANHAYTARKHVESTTPQESSEEPAQPAAD